jgi:hypothetical protein
MTTPRFQKTSEKAWKDEAGAIIPVNRLKKAEVLREKSTKKLYEHAVSISNALEKFKEVMIAECQTVMDQVYADNNQIPTDSKGNFTYYNFDRSVKVSVKVNERIDFDEMLITLCQTKLNEFLNHTVETKEDFIKQFVTDAFSKSKGSLDAKKVLSLLKYESKIKNPLFQEALRLLKDSIRRPDSKRYFQVSVRDTEGKYQNIDLNFSNI